MKKVHELKVWPEYFTALTRGDKTFELRKDDRDFCINDILILKEWDPQTPEYTGRQGRYIITYIVRNVENFGLMPGYAVLGIRRYDLSLVTDSDVQTEIKQDNER